MITFNEWNYVKHALKEISFQIRCFIMKLIFYDLPSYAVKLGIAVEEIIVDIMDVQNDGWVTVTFLLS